MTIYSEQTSRSLLTGATDPEGDPITVRRINGQIITTWPHTVALPEGHAIITELGQVSYDDGGALIGHPSEGVTLDNGTFTFQLWDGTSESPEYTATIDLLGGVSATVGYVAAPVFRLAGDQNVTGDPVTAWAASIGVNDFSPVGTPTTGTAPNGTTTVVIGADEGFTGPATGLPTEPCRWQSSLRQNNSPIQDLATAPTRPLAPSRFRWMRLAI